MVLLQNETIRLLSDHTAKNVFDHTDAILCVLGDKKYSSEFRCIQLFFQCHVNTNITSRLHKTSIQSRASRATVTGMDQLLQQAHVAASDTVN